jgi:hypothetical protein
MVRDIQTRFLYNKNVILSTLCLNLMVMPIRHNFKIEKFETPLVQWTDYPKPVFANNMRVNHCRENSNDQVNPESFGKLRGRETVTKICENPKNFD